MLSTSYRLAEASPPEAEPLSLEEVKLHLRVDHDADDELIARIIAASREACENFTGRALIARGYSLFLDAWPESRAVSLPRPPLQGVGAINVHDEDGTAEEYAGSNYFTDTSGLQGRVALKYGAVPPEPKRGFSGIEIQFTAGYGASGEDVPAALKQGMLQIAAHLYERRGDDGAQALRASGAAALFHPYRVVTL